MQSVIDNRQKTCAKIVFLTFQQFFFQRGSSILFRQKCLHSGQLRSIVYPLDLRTRQRCNLPSCSGRLPISLSISLAQKTTPELLVEVCDGQQKSCAPSFFKVFFCFQLGFFKRGNNKSGELIAKFYNFFQQAEYRVLCL